MKAFRVDGRIKSRRGRICRQCRRTIQTGEVGLSQSFDPDASTIRMGGKRYRNAKAERVTIYWHLVCVQQVIDEAPDDIGGVMAKFQDLKQKAASGELDFA